MLTKEDREQLDYLLDEIGNESLGFGVDENTVYWRRELRHEGQKAVSYLIEKIDDNISAEDGDTWRTYQYVSLLKFAASPEDAWRVGELLSEGYIVEDDDRSSKATLLEIIGRIGNAESAEDIKRCLTKIFESDAYKKSGNQKEFKRRDAGAGITTLSYILNRSTDPQEIAVIESAIQSICEEVASRGLGRIGEEEILRIRRDADPAALQRMYEECFEEDPYWKGDDSLEQEKDIASMEYDPEDSWGDDQQEETEADDLLKMLGDFERVLEASGQKFTGSNYEFFDDEKEREELFEYSKTVAEHLRDGKFADLVLIDRSSRPLYVGVMEYWRRKYPKEKMPGIYFMNPKGFKAKEDLSEEEIAQIAMECAMKGDAEEVPQARSREEIMKDLEDTYKLLFKDKEKPVLVFDSCIHSGKTLAPVKETLEAAGFTDLEIGSVNPTDSFSAKVKTDFYITSRRPEKGCYPFDRDRIIEKTFNRVYSQKNADPKARARAIRLREEIKKVMQEHLDEEEE